LNLYREYVQAIRDIRGYKGVRPHNRDYMSRLRGYRERCSGYKRQRDHIGPSVSESL
jgi:hypothetical protein